MALHALRAESRNAEGNHHHMLLTEEVAVSPAVRGGLLCRINSKRGIREGLPIRIVDTGRVQWCRQDHRVWVGDKGCNGGDSYSRKAWRQSVGSFLVVRSFHTMR